MSKIPVLDTNKKVLGPCHPAVARRLLRLGKAAIFKKYPFTIILKTAVETPTLTDHTLSIDTGSKTEGFAIIDNDNNIVAAFEIHHRGAAVKKSLSERAGYRRSRRTRKLRYRQPRWANRSRQAPIRTKDGWVYQSFGQSSKDWIAPSLMSRIYNIDTWVRRLCKLYPITKLAVEHVKFDMQLLENPEISGVEYQQGTLFGYEVKEYLLEKFDRKCFYCNAQNVPLNVEHIMPKALDGTNRIDNLTIACEPCNKKKDKQHPNEIEGKLGEQVRKALKDAKKSLKDAAAVNTIRWKIVETLKATNLPIFYGTGGKTKWHRKQAGLPKTHYYDAACVATIPKKPTKKIPVLAIHAVGYGHRKDLGSFQTKQKAHGFKNPYKRIENSNGFQKLDMVEIETKKGKFTGTINCFDKTVENKPQKLRIKTDWTVKDGRISGNITQIRKIQKRDGYAYQQLHTI